jgi:hypothetical protein
MSIDYSVDQLLTSVKQRAMTASNQNLFADSDIIRMASEELQSVVLPFMESVKGEYFVAIENQTFVQGTMSYTMPQRATGTKLRDVCLVDAQGNEVNLPYINPEDLKSSWYSTALFGFYPQGDQIVLVLGNLQGTGNYAYVRMKYFRRPNVLCDTGSTGNAGQVVSFDPTAKTITLDFAPTTWTSATTFDIVNSLPPFQSRGDSLAISGAPAGFVLTFTAALPSGLAVGDWVSEANFSPIPQIPVECHRLLETLTAARMLQYSGDPSFQVFQAQAEQQKKDLFFVLNPRVGGSARKMPLRNPLWGMF